VPQFHRTTVQIDKEFLVWYRDHFPDGTLWLTINELLRHFKAAYEANPPINYYKLGADALREALKEHANLSA
jgi:hypothetical protein